MTVDALVFLAASGCSVLVDMTDGRLPVIQFLFPVTSNAADITALMNPVMDSIYIGTEPASSLTGLNEQLNQLFEVA